MKTLNFLIICMIGLTMFAIMGFVLFLRESNISTQQQFTISLFQKNSSSKLIIEGLNDTYLIAHPVEFNITTISKECSRPHITLTNENGNVIWTEKRDPMFCDMRFSWPNTPQSWHLTEGDLGRLVVYENGVYKITISFIGNTIEKDLHVVTK